MPTGAPVRGPPEDASRAHWGSSPWAALAGVPVGRPAGAPVPGPPCWGSKPRTALADLPVGTACRALLAPSASRPWGPISCSLLDWLQGGNPMIGLRRNRQVHYLTQETMVRIRWWLGGNPCPHITRREEERRRERGVAPAVAAVTFPVALASSPPSDQSSPSLALSSLSLLARQVVYSSGANLSWGAVVAPLTVAA